MERPLVSIMVPVFDQEKYIAKAIQSALDQDYENVEIVIGDDCSDDNTESIIRSYLDNPKIKYFRNNIRLGRVKNYHNLLYEIAQGKWVVNLDGDDFFTDKSFISTCIEIINQQKDDELVFLQAGHFLSFENKDEELIKIPNIKKKHQVFTGVEYLHKFAKINHFSHLASLYNREKALKLNFYTADILSTDMESLLRLSVTGNVILLKKPIGKWLQHGTNASSTSGFEKLMSNLIWIENVSEFASSRTNNYLMWRKWKEKIAKLELTGIFVHEVKVRKCKKDRYEIFVFFWKNYKYLFINPFFLKKAICVFFNC